VKYLSLNKIGDLKRTEGTETSKYLEEKTSTEIPLVVASERGTAQWLSRIKPNCLERQAIAGDSPVGGEYRQSLSRAGHVKSCLNMGGTPSKAKYSSMTDSEQVPWGKGEKNPDEGNEIDPEIECLQTVGAIIGDRVPFV
jgi:hypothetical protein